MKFSEETLMAYADNELDAQTRTAVEEAMATDPEIARRVAKYHGAPRPGAGRPTRPVPPSEPGPDPPIPY